jgi:hypothetical protein
MLFKICKDFTIKEETMRDGTNSVNLSIPRVIQDKHQIQQCSSMGTICSMGVYIRTEHINNM